jgi:hypothetical protein
MKKILLLITVLSMQFALKAQSLQLLQLSDSLPAALSYTYNLTANDPQLVVEFIVKNVSASNVVTKVRKTLLATASGQNCYFCYGGTCYTPATIVSGTFSIGAGQQLPAGLNYGLRTEFDNNGVVGTSTVRYMIANNANANDTACVYITYNVAPMGIESFSNNLSLSNSYPNPASDVVKINYNINGAVSNAYVKVYNALGSLVKSIPVNASKSTVQFDVTDLEEGFYLYTLSSNGKNSTTRKLIVKH